MENQKGGLKFDDALKFVQPRPWLVDDLGNPKTYPTNYIFVIKRSMWSPYMFIMIVLTIIITATKISSN